MAASVLVTGGPSPGPLPNAAPDETTVGRTEFEQLLWAFDKVTFVPDEFNRTDDVGWCFGPFLFLDVFGRLCVVHSDFAKVLRGSGAGNGRQTRQSALRPERLWSRENGHRVRAAKSPGTSRPLATPRLYSAILVSCS